VDKFRFDLTTGLVAAILNGQRTRHASMSNTELYCGATR